MQPMSEGRFDVMNLAKDLRSEKLFIEAELESVRQLNDSLERCVVELAQASWTNTQQRCNLKQIVAQGDFATASCSPQIEYVLSPVFVDAHKVLRYQDSLVLGEVIGRIRLCPEVASAWLVAAEGSHTVSTVARALTCGVYAGDCRPVRHVLMHLARHRLATAEDPRRMISVGSSSYSRLYSELVEGFRPARQFLTAALKQPLLPLLQLDEYLLVDSDKAMDRVRRYCSPSGNSCEYQQKLAKYRKWTVTSLVTTTRRFIASLTEHWVCFPPTIAWVVRQTAAALKESGRLSQEDVHAICTNLIFTNFICQAIMSPEAYGITDIPITNIGRFNLMQVAQTLQVLCLLKHQQVDSKLRELYSRFDKESVYPLVDALLADDTYSAVPGEENIYLEEDCDASQGDSSVKTDPVVNPNVALFTRRDIQLLVSVLKKIPSNLSNGTHPASLENSFVQMHISPGPAKGGQPTSAVDSSYGNINEGFASDCLSTENESNGDSAWGVTPNGSVAATTLDAESVQSQDRELYQILKTIHPDQIARLQTLLRRLPENSFTKETDKFKTFSNGVGPGGSGAASSPAKKKSSLMTSISNSISSSSGSGNTGSKPREDTEEERREVLMIKLQCDPPYEPVGLVSESKVLEWHYANAHRAGRAGLPLPVIPLLEGADNDVAQDLATLQQQGDGDQCADPKESNAGIEEVVSGIQHRGQEKRTRFSLSHDEGSIGNTSDNLEAASNHSVTSSLEMETEDQNDNLSDMVVPPAPVSANVSGRGSPNISGRDTPSSQVTEGDNPAPGLAMPPPHRLPPNAPLNPSSASKQAKLVKRVRSNIEDKFCKFEIKKLLEGDETVSIISDTWSTDVLASDSETIGESSYERSVIAQHHNMLIGGGAVNGGPPVPPDASETASESAWSTDALVSDSDRLTEVDIDECNSIGRLEVGVPGTPMHHQFSPHNNIKRDALLNTRQQMSAALVHEAHPDSVDTSAGSGDMARGASKDDVASDCSSNTSGGLPVGGLAGGAVNGDDPFPGDVVLRKPHNGPSSSSVYAEMSSSSESSNEGAGVSSGSLALFISNDVIGVVSPPSGVSAHSSGELIPGSVPVQSRRPKAYHEHVVPPEVLNGTDCVSSVYHIRDGGTPCTGSPGEDVQGYPLPLPLPLAVIENVNMFEFEEQSSNRLNGGEESQVLESGISTPDGMFHSGAAFVAPTNNSATSRWLNDPCQQFPSARHDLATTPSNMSNKRSTSHQDVAAADTDLSDMKRSNTDSMFRPIRADSMLSDIDDSGISDLNGCTMMPFLNGTEDLTHQEFSSTMSSDISFNTSCNGFVDHYHESHLDTRTHAHTLNNTNGEAFARTVTTEVDFSTSGCNATTNINTVSEGSNPETTSKHLLRQTLSPFLGGSTEPRPPTVTTSAATLPRNSTLSTSMKPNVSTGAIPKSISFDATAEKIHRHRRSNHTHTLPPGGSAGQDLELAECGALNFGDIKNNMKKSGGQILNKIKNFKNKSRGLAASATGFGRRSNNQFCGPDDMASSKTLQIASSTDTTNGRIGDEEPTKPAEDLTEDILAKYRRKASSSSSEAANSDAGHQHWSGCGGGPQPAVHSNGNALHPDDSNTASLLIEAPAHSEVPVDVYKKKLRQALATMDLHSIELSARVDGAVWLASALSLAGDCYLSATLPMSAPLEAVRQEARARGPYLSYLARCRRSLLYNIARIQSETEWHRCEALRQAGLVAAGRALVSLAGREGCLASLQERLRSGLSDEKRDLLTQTLSSLNNEMAQEEAWAGASEWELEQAALTVERTVMSRVYLQAMFPNGDGDVMRDQLLREHIVRLSTCQAGVPPFDIASSMWVPVLRLLAQLPAYKAPLDKVRCIQACTHAIVALLSSHSGTPGADHLTPALVYVIIKVNPLSLLSTIQYVNTFLSSPLEGELLYCWTQFCSAVEFIKTMDYTRR